jgi:hypothetical protein
MADKTRRYHLTRAWQCTDDAYGCSDGRENLAIGEALLECARTDNLLSRQELWRAFLVTTLMPFINNLQCISMSNVLMCTPLISYH